MYFLIFIYRFFYSICKIVRENNMLLFLVRSVAISFNVLHISIRYYIEIEIILNLDLTMSIMTTQLNVAKWKKALQCKWTLIFRNKLNIKQYLNENLHNFLKFNYERENGLPSGIFSILQSRESSLSYLLFPCDILTRFLETFVPRSPSEFSRSHEAS